MNEGLKKFEELLKTDKAFQIKLQEAAQAYNGEQTDEAVFDNVLVPLAAEYGITATFDEVNEYLAHLQDNEELNQEELDSVAGGKDGWNTYGVGMTLCFYVGMGIGGSGNGNSQGGCIAIGGGSTLGAGISECLGYGISGDTRE